MIYASINNNMSVKIGEITDFVYIMSVKKYIVSSNQLMTFFFFHKKYNIVSFRDNYWRRYFFKNYYLHIFEMMKLKKREKFCLYIHVKYFNLIITSFNMSATPTTVIMMSVYEIKFPTNMLFAIVKHVFRYGVKKIYFQNNGVFVRLVYSPKTETIRQKLGNLPVRYMRTLLESPEEMALLEKALSKYDFALLSSSPPPPTVKEQRAQLMLTPPPSPTPLPPPPQTPVKTIVINSDRSKQRLSSAKKLFTVDFDDVEEEEDCVFGPESQFF